MKNSKLFLLVGVSIFAVCPSVLQEVNAAEANSISQGVVLASRAESSSPMLLRASYNASEVLALLKDVEKTRRELAQAEQSVSYMRRESDLGSRIVQRGELRQTEKEVADLRSRLRKLEDDLRRAESAR